MITYEFQNLNLLMLTNEFQKFNLLMLTNEFQKLNLLMLICVCGLVMTYNIIII